MIFLLLFWTPILTEGTGEKRPSDQSFKICNQARFFFLAAIQRKGFWACGLMVEGLLTRCGTLIVRPPALVPVCSPKTNVTRSSTTKRISTAGWWKGQSWEMALSSVGGALAKVRAQTSPSDTILHPGKNSGPSKQQGLKCGGQDVCPARGLTQTF